MNGDPVDEGAHQHPTDKNTPLTRFEAEMLQLCKILLGKPSETLATVPDNETPREQLETCLLIWGQYLRAQELQLAKKKESSLPVVHLVILRTAALLRAAFPCAKIALNWAAIFVVFGVLIPALTGVLEVATVTNATADQPVRFSLLPAFVSGIFTFKVWARVTIDEPRLFEYNWDRHWAKV